jgi:hypothetical protein
MARTIVRLAVSTVLVLCASSAGAQCKFGGGSPAHGPVRTKGTVTYLMVRAYSECVDPSAQTVSGLDSCMPPTPADTAGERTIFSYARGGSCYVKMVSKLTSDCSRLESDSGLPLGLAAGPCHVDYFKSKCRKINGIGYPIGTSEFGWKLLVGIRVTFDDAVSNDMTVADLTLEFDYSVPLDGNMQLRRSAAQALAEGYNTTDAKLPACTSVEVVSATIVDPAGLVFARPGVATGVDCPPSFDVSGDSAPRDGRATCSF